MARTLLDFFMAGVQGFYPMSIPYSARFDSARSCYLTRTPGVAGNRKTWTLAFWMKPCDFGLRGIVGAGDGSTANYLFRIYMNGGALIFDSRDSGGAAQATKLTYTTALLRDPSAFYHIMYAVDTTQATVGNRIKLFINGIQQSFDTSGNVDPALNADLSWNRAAEHRIGECMDLTWLYPLSSYLADVCFVDGAALTQFSFGQFSSQNPNVWVPKTPTGLTYGTNGFHLAFGNAAALGTDTSGQGNTFTSNGLASTDQMADTPTNNYCTLNPLLSGNACSNGNLIGTCSSSSTRFGVGSIGMLTGKFACEVKGTSGSGWSVGICSSDYASYGSLVNYLGTNTGVGHGYGYQSDGSIIHNGSAIQTGLATYALNDVIGITFDADNRELKFYKNNSLVATVSSIPAGTYMFAGAYDTGAYTWNFGATAFAYTPTTGFKALCSANIADPLPTIITSGSFTGNANADGPFIYTKGTPETLTINGNAVTWGTHADKLANGFKLRTASTSYNSTGTNTWTATAASDMRFPRNNAQKNP